MKDKVTSLIKDTEPQSPSDQNDTIRLWEGYKEQAYLWRALALLQIPTTLIALIFALVMWNTRSIVLNVPPKPLPGQYLAKDIPDSEFIDFAQNYVNLIATYQPSVARRQFLEAKNFLWGEAVSKFEDEMIKTELEAIEKTQRTQIFFVDPTQTKIKRHGKLVTVSFVGERYKSIAGREMPSVRTKFYITMSTIPRNKFNPYGIVIVNVSLENLER